VEEPLEKLATTAGEQRRRAPVARLAKLREFGSGFDTNNKYNSPDELRTRFRSELEPGLGYAHSGADDQRLVYTACDPRLQPNERIMSTNSHSNIETAAADTTLVSPQAWIGLDWGHRTHAFALHDLTGFAEVGTIKHSPESLHHWLRELAQRYGGRPVALAIEANRGAVVDGLRQYPWLIIYPINPVTSARYRRAFTPSCAKDDIPDARVLLDLVRHHAHKLRPLQTQDEQTQKLARLVVARRDMVDRRTQLLNQLTSLLKSYFPQALELIGELNSTLAIDFLTRWPDLISLKASPASAIKRFYCAHNLRRPELLTTRVKQIQEAVALSTDDSLIDIAGLQLRLLLDQLRAFRKHLPIVEAEIKTAFAAHPEAHLFRDLPGAGAQLAPRLCVAFGTLRHLYPDPASL